MLKRIIGTTLLALLAWPLATTQVQAQTLKVGYTDHEVIIANMPEYRDIQKELQDMYTKGQQELQTQSQDFQDKVQRYQKQQSLLSEQKRKEREDELVQQQTDLQKAAQLKEQELNDHERELMAPLLDRVQDAIDKVAKAKGLDIVLRSQAGGQALILYVNEDRIVDITLDVARELGIDVGEAEGTGGAEASN